MACSATMARTSRGSGWKKGCPAPRSDALLETPDGTLWVATGAGLARLQHNRFETVDLGVGRPSLDLHALDQGNGKIYVGIDQGLLAAKLQ